MRQPGSDGGPADGEFEEPFAAEVDGLQRVAELTRPAGPFLPDGQRDGVLEVGAPELDHVHPLGSLVFDGLGDGGGGGGMRWLSSSSSAEMCIAVGNVSLLNWPARAFGAGFHPERRRKTLQDRAVGSARHQFERRRADCDRAPALSREHS